MIVSSDKDFYQLLSDNVVQWSPGQKRFLTQEIIENKYQILTNNFCLARCFIGDASDSLDGVRGAGIQDVGKKVSRFF